MNRKKSIALLIVVSVVIALLAVAAFAQFRIPFYKNGTRIYQSFLGAIELDGDLEGSVAYELTLKEDISAADTGDVDPEEVVKTLEYRLEALGYASSAVTAYRESETDNWSFRIEMRASDTYAEDIEVVARYGELEFTDGSGAYLFGRDMVRSAKYIAQTVAAQTTHYVELAFTDEGIDELEAAIDAAAADEDSSGFTLTITLGDTQLFSSSLTKDTLSQNALYIGGENTTETAARQLALQIASGGLAYEYEIGDPMLSAPLLGENAASLVFWGCLAALLVIIVAMVFAYGGLGLISGVTLFFFGLMEITMLILVPGIVLNFAGVLGIFAALLLSADSLAVIMHRVREEYRNGKTAKAAVKTAYRRSWLTIVETDAVLAAGALLMYFLCKGYANCFAITFGIGVALSALITMFVSYLFASMALPLFGGKSEKFLKLKRAEQKEEAAEV